MNDPIRPPAGSPGRERPAGGRRKPAFAAADPEPFWRTSEFTRFAWIAGILVTFGIVALLTAQRAERSAAPPETSAPPPPATTTLTPEQIAERELFLATAFEGALRDQSNGDAFQETTGYRKLLEQIGRFDAAEFSARVERVFEPAAAVADPDAWRGQFVRVRGVLGNIQPKRLARPILERRDAWRGQLGSGVEFDEKTVLEFLDRPFPDLSLEDQFSRAVEVEGVFYRVGTWTTDVRNSKDQLVEVTWTLPWLFVRNVRLIDEGEEPTRTFLQEHALLILGILAFVVFGSRLVAFWVESRRKRTRQKAAPQGIREMFEQKLREKGLPPAPPPSTKP